jgi:hypothetical protein
MAFNSIDIQDLCIPVSVRYACGLRFQLRRTGRYSGANGESVNIDIDEIS